MIQMQTRLNGADNTGAKELMCIKVLGGTRRRFAGLADVIVCSVKSVIPGSNIKKGTIVKAVIVRTKKSARREDGSYVKFDSNAAVLIDNNRNPIGTRVFGAVARELRGKDSKKKGKGKAKGEEGFVKIISLASEVV